MASFIEYLNSEEYQDFLNKQKESLDLYTKQAKDYFETLDYDDKLKVFFHVMFCFYENEFIDKGSYRSLLYQKLGFECDSYSLGIDCGLFALHNSVFTHDDLIESINMIFNKFNIDNSQKNINSALCLFQFGRDCTDFQKNYQLKFEF